MRWLKRILFGLFGALLLLLIALAGVVAALNTEAGQRFAVRQINHFGRDTLHLGGLTGHFPSDLTIPSLQLIDSKGVWLSAMQVRLAWSPLALLHRHLVIRALTAQTIDITRPPLFPSEQPKKHASSTFSIPHISITLTKLEIGALRLSPPLASQTVTLHVTGHAALPNFHRADIAFDATSTPDIGAYHLAGTLNPQTVDLTLAINEQPGGLIGHLIAPENKQPLKITTTLNGPRNQAALHGSATFGNANLAVTGVLGLDQDAPMADIQLTIPALAPFATLAGVAIAGSTTLHLTASKQHSENSFIITAKDDLILTQAPKGLDKLLIGKTKIDLSGVIRDKHVQLQHLSLDSPGFSLTSHGALGARHVDLIMDATLPRLAVLLPQLRGALYLQTHINGPLHQLRLDATLGGEISPPGTPSDPFLLTLHARDLPNAPEGTLTGTGVLAGAPLALNAHFTYNPKAASQIELDKATWKSIAAEADLRLKTGARLPTGTGQMTIGTLADLDNILALKLSGAVQAHFAYQQDQRLNLAIAVKNTSAGKQVTGLNATLNASGAVDAIAITADMTASSLIGSPAKLSLAGTLNAPAQALNLDELNANWRGIPTKLVAPTYIEIKPEMAIRHLDLALANAHIIADGSISPTLDATISVKNFDLTLLRQISPEINAAGQVTLTAQLTGNIKAPQGKITLKADRLRYLTPTTATLPAAALTGTANLQEQTADVALRLDVGGQGQATLHGSAPLTMRGPMNLNLTSQAALSLLDPFLAAAHIKTTGEARLNAHMTGTPQAPVGLITLTAHDVHSETGAASALPPATLNARAMVKDQAAQLNMALDAGPDINLTADGHVPFSMTRAMALSVAGRLNLELLDPILAANGSLVHGIVTTNLRLGGAAKAPRVNGTLTLANGSFLNVTSGLNLTAINANIIAADRLITLRDLSAKAGEGKITGHGTVDLSGPIMPVDLALNATNATPIASDLLTETLNAALTLQGGLKTSSTLAGNIDILKANINIPRSLPPSVAVLPIHYVGEAPPAPKTSSAPTPTINLALNAQAKNQIFIRGDGLFAELGGHLRVEGTTANPQPTGGFSMVRGNFSLAGKTLQFTNGKIDFNGDGFIPALDLEATTPTNNGGTATLTVGGTATKPKISLSSSPPSPSDEILAQLLFAQSSESLSPFQAASLAAALAQISGIGGGFSPLSSTRDALGLDQLSIGSDGKGGPSVQAGRYVAPGVYVGASQSTTGQGSKANVEINLYKGLKLQSATGTDSTGQSSSSIGLSYQFSY